MKLHNRVNVGLSQEQYQVLVLMAQRQGISKSALFRSLLAREAECQRLLPGMADVLARQSEACRQTILESEIGVVGFYREQVRIEQQRNERMEELNRLLCNLFDGYGYTFRDALDGVRLLLEEIRVQRRDR